MDRLALQLDAAVSFVSPSGKRILAQLADSEGRIACADVFARGLGLHSRHQLTRALKREGLPQIEELCAWIKALQLLLEWDQTHRSLYALAVDGGLYPPTCYRLVKRVTGTTWRQACADGFAMMLLRFRNRCLMVRERTAGGVSTNTAQIA